MTRNDDHVARLKWLLTELSKARHRLVSAALAQAYQEGYGAGRDDEANAVSLKDARNPYGETDA